MITSGLIRIGKWSNESIMEGLRTRFACGSKAYEIERRKRRLPSSRTLCERLQSLRFDSGCLDEIFDILSLKIKQLPDDDKDCVLLFDEMAIQSGTDYCPNLKKFVGNVTLPEHTGIANHALVFMLAGVKTHWKQVIGYHFTGDSINNGCLKDIIFELIRKAEGIGFRVHAVVCDCGGKQSCQMISYFTFSLETIRFEYVASLLKIRDKYDLRAHLGAVKYKYIALRTTVFILK